MSSVCTFDNAVAFSLWGFKVCQSSLLVYGLSFALALLIAYRIYAVLRGKWYGNQEDGGRDD